MTDFPSAVTDYLITRRAMGYKLAEDGRLLGQFAAYLETVHAEHLSVDHALSWATQPGDAAPAWHALRLTTVRPQLRSLPQRSGPRDGDPVGQAAA